MFVSKLELRSFSQTRPLILSLEPWGEDYTFAPDRTATILARGAGPEAPWFSVWSADDGVTFVSIEGEVAEWEVWDADVRVECGHGRRR